MEAAALRGVRVYPISPLYLDSGSRQLQRAAAGVVMGYALLEQPEIERGVQCLADALASLQ